jgi:hypothetical protein
MVVGMRLVLNVALEATLADGQCGVCVLKRQQRTSYL